MGGYGYEIIGGLLIVLSSLVGEEMKTKWKVGFYVVFVVVAVGYSGIGIYLRREANARETTERQERKDELQGVRQDMSNILSAFSGLGPSVASLNGDVANLRRELESAKVKHDTDAIAKLDTKTDAAQRRVDTATKALLGALVPGTARLLRSWNGDWNSPEGNALLSNADYIRRGLLEGVQPTPEDTVASRLFEKNEAGFSHWDPEKAARYLESLVGRLRIVLPPTDLSVTKH
jgi:hypothetical protein